MMYLFLLFYLIGLDVEYIYLSYCFDVEIVCLWNWYIEKLDVRGE